MNKNILKNSTRLQQIFNLVDKQYTHIWDCCCDHGLLGISLLNGNIAKSVHFVDVVPNLMNKLEQKLTKFWLGDNRAWHVHCIDVKNLPISQFVNNPKQDNHLIIIAGVGGELIIECMRELLIKTAALNVEFILCPVHHNYNLRQYLRLNNVGLISEQLIKENNRYYEILHLSPQVTTIVSDVGDSQWDLSDPSHQEYLQKTIDHYLRISKQGINNQYLINNSNGTIQQALESYQALLK